MIINIIMIVIIIIIIIIFGNVIAIVEIMNTLDCYCYCYCNCYINYYYCYYHHDHHDYDLSITVMHNNMPDVINISSCTSNPSTSSALGVTHSPVNVIMQMMVLISILMMPSSLHYT